MITQKESPIIQAPPRAIELEEAVNGGAMLDNSVMPILAQLLAPKHFYDEDQMEIYDACLDLYSRRRPVDLLTVMEELKSRGSLDRIGGPAALAELTNRVAGTANTEYHARIIIQRWLMRELGKLGTQVARESYHDDPFELIEFIGTYIDNLSGFREDGAGTMYRAAERVLEHARVAAKNPTETVGFPLFGFKPLDERLQGVRFGDAGGDYVLIIGPSGSGKSSLSNNAIIQAEKHDLGIYSWSNEMTQEDQARRFLSGKLDINGIKIAKGTFLEDEYTVANVAATVRDLERKNIYLDSGRMTINRMVSIVSYYKRNKGIQVFMFDRLELFDLKSISRDKETAKEDIAVKIRQLANEFKVTIILFAQLKKLDSKFAEPDMDHIKGASEVPQSATKIIYITRPELKNILEDEEGNSLKGVGFMNVIKSTHFEPGKVRMRFYGPRTRWEMDGDLDDPDETGDELPGIGGIPSLNGHENRNFDEDLPF